MFKKDHYGLKTGVIQGRLTVSNQTSKADETVSHVYYGPTLAIKLTDGTVTQTICFSQQSVSS